jgi:hypothetical protein
VENIGPPHFLRRKEQLPTKNPSGVTDGEQGDGGNEPDRVHPANGIGHLIEADALKRKVKAHHADRDADPKSPRFEHSFLSKHKRWQRGLF